MGFDHLPSAREETAGRLVESLQRKLGAHCVHLTDPDVVELMLNENGRLWIDRLGAGMNCVGEMAPAAAEQFIGTVASTMRAVVNHDTPILECELPAGQPFGGARFEAVIPPATPAPIFAIRRKALRIFTLTDYERGGIMTARQRAVIESAVMARNNILVSGGTGTGKTTLANAILAEIARATPEHRLVIMEDTAELQCAAENAVTLRSTKTVSLQSLARATMRLRPDRIIVGEVRGGEALELLKLWNTGHEGGLCTVHANSAALALERIGSLIAEVSQSPQHTLIAEAVNLIVQLKKISAHPGRLVSGIIAVRGFKNGEYVLESLEA